MQQPTRLERRIDDVAHRLLRGAPVRGARASAVEVGVFLLKQAWACVFGAALLLVIVAARLWWPDDAPLARNDALTISAVLIQAAMLAFRLETGGAVGDRPVPSHGYRDGAVQDGRRVVVLRGGGRPAHRRRPLFSGFMYAAVGSYMVRVYRLFDLTFARYPRRWITAAVAAAIYANFFTHHVLWDARWVLLALVIVLWLPTEMHARVWRRTIRLPLLLVYAGVATFIYLAENIATWAGAWLYPDQLDGWHPVSATKLVSWFL